MPKQRITKEMVVEAAFELARTGGMEQVIVKNIAQKLDCSVQPIYSYCQSMEGLRKDVVGRASRFIQEYIASHIDPSDFFRSTGHAYIQLAKEEPHLFQLFVLKKREHIRALTDLYQTETNPEAAVTIAETLQISLSQAKALHLHMLIYTVGIGTILATTDSGIPEEEITSQLELAYQAFLRQALEQ
jgi:AcrR family transcriptional regulator